MDSRPQPALGELVVGLAGRLRAAWRDALAPWGLSPHQGRALLVLARTDGMRVGELATRLRIAPRSATEVVDGLTEAGLVERRPDPRDRRATTVVLTGHGHGVVRSIQVDRADTADQLFEQLSDRDRASLRRILGSLVDPD